MSGTADRDLIADAARMLGISIDDPTGNRSATNVEASVGSPLPASVRRLLDYPGIIGRIAETYCATPVFPDEIQIDVDDDDLDGADGPGRLLRLMNENQGVCVWGVPLDHEVEPPVIVWGDFESAEPFETFSATVAEFVYGFAWDRKAMEGAAGCVQAQAAPVDDAALAFLRTALHETTPTFGWPCRQTLRFEGDGDLAVLLWSGRDQCDWFISATQPEEVRRLLRGLMDHSDLRTTLWSADPTWEAVLSEVRDG